MNGQGLRFGLKIQMVAGGLLWTFEERLEIKVIRELKESKVIRGRPLMSIVMFVKHVIVPVVTIKGERLCQIF